MHWTNHHRPNPVYPVGPSSCRRLRFRARKKVRASQIQLCRLVLAPLRPSIWPPLAPPPSILPMAFQPCSSLERPPLQPPAWRIPGLKASELYLLKYSQLSSRILHGTHPHAQRRHHPFLSTFFPHVRISLLAGPFFLFLPVALSNPTFCRTEIKKEPNEPTAKIPI